MPAAKREPKITIYGGGLWRKARAEAKRISSPDERAGYLGMMDCLEAGWAIVLPLGLACKASVRRDGPQAVDVQAYVDLDIIDDYQDMAYWWRDALLGETPRISLGSTADQAEYILRHLRVLQMATSDASFPASVRPLVAPAVEAFTTWVAAVPAHVDAALAHAT